MRNFVWAGDIRSRKLVTVSWSTTCSDIKEGGLGIRSLSHINKASLLTLLWQVTTQDSELASICRLRFGSPGRTAIRYYKSSIWHGLKENWPHIISNSQWVIGNGSSVNFWTENWLGEPLVDILHIPPDIHHHLRAKVSDFRMGGSWYLPNFVASNPVISKIRNTYFSQDPDILVWMSSSSGILTAKDAYAHFRPSIVNGLWSSLWSKVVPPSKSFVVWRLLHGKMPTDDMLTIRGCHGPSRCSLCTNQEETMHHLFFTCSFANGLWNWLQASFQRQLDLSSIHSLLQDCLTISSLQVKEAMLYAIIFTINIIWNCKNKTRFEDFRGTFRQAVGNIRNQLAMAGSLFYSSAPRDPADWSMLRGMGITLRPPRAPNIKEVRWVPPPLGWVKVNTDGAAKGSPGPAGGGGIFRNEKGEFLGAFVTHLGSQTAIYAEFHTICQAIILASRKGWSRLWIECDSMVAIAIFQNRSQIPWTLRHLWLRCTERMETMNIKISHVFREGNSCADALAKRGADNIDSGWWNNFPTFILPFFSNDAYNIPSYRFDRM